MNVARRDPSETGDTHEFDFEGTPSEAVVEAVAAVLETDPVDGLEPLYEAVDPDALDSLFESTAERNRDGGLVSFAYGGVVVTLYADRRIVVAPSRSFVETAA